jgi:putative ABC transport system permease protein
VRNRDSRAARLAWLATGEAGTGVAWVLAAAALLAAFLATAAPRELAVTSTTALQRTLAALDPVSKGITVTAGWQPLAGDPTTELMPSQVAAIRDYVGARLPAPLDSPSAQRWGGLATNPVTVTNPAPSAIFHLIPPTVEVSYHTALTRHARLIAGRMPGGVTAAGAVPVAATAPVAARFSLRLGSVVDLANGLRLAVTGIVAPTDPDSPYWTIDPLPAQPGVQQNSYWSAGLIAGAASVAAVQDDQQNQFVQGTWFFPLDTRAVTAATLPALLAGVSRFTSSASIPAGAVGSPGPLAMQIGQSATVGSSLAASLSGFLAQQRATTAVGALIVAGLLVAGLVLLLICVRLAADAYRPELTLLRARGAGTGQVTSRVLARAGLLAVPGAVAGAVLAVLAVRGQGATAPWRPAIATAVISAGALTALAAWPPRRGRAQAGRAGLDTTVRRSPRRAVAEGTVIVLAVGGLAILRLTGTGAGQSDLYTTVSPVLAAIAASLLAARLYPFPVRGLLRVAAARPGPVGFLALAQAARARISAVLPVLALVLALTVAAFAALVAGSVAAGQELTSWQQVGADATVAAPATAIAGVISPREQAAAAATLGVTAVAAVWTLPGNGNFTAQVTADGAGPGAKATAAALAVVDPRPYAALAAHTPWGGFPAGLLARRAGPVPVLASPGLAAALGGAGRAATVNLNGAVVPVRIAAVIGPTPAESSGGAYLIVPQWAQAQLDYIPGPDLLLATGPGTDSRQFAAVAARAGHGSVLTLRQPALRALRNAPAQAAADRVNTLGIWAAAALVVLALLVGLAAAAGGRAALAQRMAALGMTARQARALDLGQALPLLASGIGGMLAAAIGLALVVGPALNLAVFAAGGQGAAPSSVSVQLQPWALVWPAAGAIVAALIIVAGQRALATRRESAASIGPQEAG